MSYPERGVTYKHKPKFIERMKRAEGGPTNLPNPATDKAVAPIPIEQPISDKDWAAKSKWSEHTLGRLGIRLGRADE